MKYKIFLLFLFFQIQIFAQIQTSGSIQGKVYDAVTGASVLGANMNISYKNLTIQTNPDGEYIFNNIPPGKYTIKCRSDEFEESVQNIEVSKGINSKLNFRLTSKKLDDKKTFYIGGIEVTANANVKNPSLSTVSLLSSGEIEHLQASNLGDVLQLLPGVQTVNPSMSGTRQATIRQVSTTSSGYNLNSTANQISSLGTQIIIDDVPVSNNANMQGELGSIASTTGGGIDLRLIPADNINSVEVIRGVASAKYGDMAGGIIRVSTTSNIKKIQPNRIKAKYNPETQEFNFNGGMNAIDAVWNYNVNVARSIRDVRLDGDSYTRLNAQLSATHELSRKWSLQHKFLYSRLFDEFDETDDPYLSRQAHYNREYSLQYSLVSNTKFSDISSLDVIGSFSYKNQDSYYQEEITRDNSIFSTRLTQGTQEGIFVGGVYFSQYWTKGTPILGYFNSEYKTSFNLIDLENSISLGSSLKYEKNYGEGKIFNPLSPPRYSQSMGDRPRKFDDIPGEFLVSFFIADRIKGKFFFPFQLEAGLRYELYDPKGIFNASHGQYLNPRINLHIPITGNYSIRFGYGISSKAPTLSQLYPSPKYFDVIDTNFYSSDPGKRFSLVSTYIVPIANPNLKGFTEKQFEIGTDINFGNWQFSANAFSKETNDGLNSLSLPYYLVRTRYPNWPSTGGAYPKDTGVSTLRTTTNNRYIKNRGIEFTIISPTIYFLNGKLQIDAAYNESKTGQSGGIVYDISFSGLNPRQYFYKPTITWGDRLLITYRLSAASQVLGLWATLTVEQWLLERDRTEGYDDAKYPIGYTDKDGKTVYLSEEERRSPAIQAYVKNYDDYYYRTEDRPNMFLVNLRVSKSLFSGAEVSFFVNNLLNSRPLYATQRNANPGSSFDRRGISLYYGIEFSSIIDKILPQ